MLDFLSLYFYLAEKAYMSPSFFVSFFDFLNYYHYYTSRLCVSASQDGKLIVWDSITTNKVGQSKGVVYHGYSNGSSNANHMKSRMCFPN